MFCWIPNILQSSRENFKAKRRSWLLMILWGRPNWANMCIAYRATVCLLKISSSQGININPLEQSWSVIVRMESYPFASGSFVMKLMATTLNGVASSLANIGCNGARVGRLFTLFLWQSAQPFTYSATSFHRFGHHPVCSVSCTILAIPGCPCIGKSWCALITSRVLWVPPV